jgi:hypothetical protein
VAERYNALSPLAHFFDAIENRQVKTGNP